MRFISTADRYFPSVSFKEAVLRCLPEEGLFVPEALPVNASDMRQFFLHMDEATSYKELAASLIPVLSSGELNPGAAQRIAESACAFEPELITLNDKLSILNLYKGPAGSYMDFGTNFLAAVLEEIFAPQSSKAMVVSAVRGGMGYSIAKAFFERRGITAALLYPEHIPITGIDAAACAGNGGNIITIQVQGTADDCQDIVNSVIRDRPFAERYNITSANAINPGRLLAQIFYFLYSFIMLKKNLSGDLVFSIPSGNLGNLTAGLYAWKLGMPVNGFIAAMNSNNAAGAFMNGDAFRPRPLIVTNSPVLDVARPSNLERLRSFYNEAPLIMKNMVFPKSIDDETTVAAIKNARKHYGIFLDPQSAVAFAAAEQRAGEKDFDGHIVVFATEHPALYAETIYRATGETITVPEKIKALESETEPAARIHSDPESFENAIASCV